MIRRFLGWLVLRLGGVRENEKVWVIVRDAEGRPHLEEKEAEG